MNAERQRRHQLRRVFLIFFSHHPYYSIPAPDNNQSHKKVTKTQNRGRIIAPGF
jgi:hypothetical protein